MPGLPWLSHALSFMPLTTPAGVTVPASGTWEGDWTDLGANPNVESIRVFLRATAAATAQIQWSPDGGQTAYPLPPSLALGAGLSGVSVGLTANQAALLEAPVALRHVRVVVNGSLLGGGTLFASMSTVNL